MLQLNMLVLFIILHLLFTVASNAQQATIASSIPLCLSYERETLLTFKNSFDNFFYSWKINDCCLWEGVTCDHSSGHVTELHLRGNRIDWNCLAGSCLTGRFPSNNTLFNLRHLRHLDLSFNNFSATPIPSDFGRLSNLEYLNLSNSGFTGHVPREIGWLSQLTTLDFYRLHVTMSNFKSIIANLTHLRELDLTYVNISSDLPPMIANLSQLESLQLGDCDLQGEFHKTTILTMPNLRVLDLEDNYNLYCHFSTSRWRSPLELVDFSYTNFSGILPAIIGNSSNFSMRFFNIDNCHFYGDTPSWIWNVSWVLSAHQNSLSGSIPATLNATKLSRISAIYFSRNMITGTIPAWLFTLPSLISINFDYNNLTGIDQSANANLSVSSSTLVEFTVRSNKLQGRIPEVIYGLHNLQTLDLRENNLTGTILLSKLFKLQKLGTLHLSYNNLSIVDDVDVESFASIPSMEILGLSSCNLGHFPSFLKKQEMLTELHLSNSGIRDVVPEWFVNLTFLQVLDLSYNFLTGSLENLQRANTELSPAVSSSLCRLSQLQLLDMSYNNLTGFIPNCFNYSISCNLDILDLQQNNLQGIIPSIIFENCSSRLFTLSLHGNLLQGPPPESLGNCKRLEFLDVGDNNLNGTFPHWLYILPDLEVLVLSSNNFQGPLISSNKTTTFQKLRILDISNNNLTGSLPPSLLVGFKAMMEVNANNPDNDGSYMVDLSYMDDYPYQESIKAWVKGFYRELPKISNSLFMIDVSKNRLEGEIPSAIGDLVNIRWLNLARNKITGNIPRSLGNLSQLESLDLSSNKLEGQIPSELVNLNFLEFFNVSENNLVGPLPTGKQFNTFLDPSYLGNPRLCGEVLTKKCTKNDEPSTSAPTKGSGSRSSSFHVWEIVSMGFGCGFLAGSVWGYFIVWESNYYWVVKLIFKTEVFMMRWPQRRRLQNI